MGSAYCLEEVHGHVGAVIGSSGEAGSSRTGPHRRADGRQREDTGVHRRCEGPHISEVGARRYQLRPGSIGRVGVHRLIVVKLVVVVPAVQCAAEVGHRALIGRVLHEVGRGNAAALRVITAHAAFI